MKLLNKKQIVPLFMALTVGIASCSKDETYTVADDLSPSIRLDSETAVYTVKSGHTLRIAPEITNGHNAVFSWKLDGEVLGRDSVLEWSSETEGSYFITFRVDNRYGWAEEELRVDVARSTPPVIAFALINNRKMITLNRSYTFAPHVEFGEDAEYEWKLDGVTVGNGTEYTYTAEKLGIYPLSLTVTNEDGSAEAEVTVEVVEKIPATILIPPVSSIHGDPLEKSVFIDRKLYLRPIVLDVENPVYSWAVKGPEDATARVQTGATDRMFSFSAPAEGEYEITFTVNEYDGSAEDAGSVTYKVTCYGPESSGMRGTTGSATWNRVYEYSPAPGQFVNNPRGGFTGEETTVEKVIEYAEGRLLDNGWGVSLGGFGGSIVVGFDHSIPNAGMGVRQSDFSISGNSFDGSSEPGIVWVMQDTNGNGLPDDEWYELKGSEYDKRETTQEYWIIHTRPADGGTSIPWYDCEGNSGTTGAGYYTHNFWPAWYTDDMKMFYGTRLPDNVTYKNGMWRTEAYEYGYADNFGSDAETNATNGNRKNYFNISNAVNLDGTPADLQYIDFIKVQCGINATAGILGEVSTEVSGFTDENLLNQ